jgi:heme exporter protein A
VLTAVDLTLWRGTNCLFDGLSFEIADGRALLVRGANGSGKTTLLRVLCGLTRPESGRVEWNGTSIENDRQGFGAQLAYIGHATGLKADLTVTQNLAFVARMNGRQGHPWERYVESLNLSHCADLEVRYLSAGQQRRAALARMLMSDARIWCMDEPFTNLDAAGREFVVSQIKTRLEGGGTAVVAAHHDLEFGPVRLDTLFLGDAG